MKSRDLSSSSLIKCMILHPKDNIGLLVSSNSKQGQIIEVSKKRVKLKKAIPQGHKVAIRKIKYKEPIVKFGQVIGISKKDILPGEHVHIHNIEFSRGVQFSGKYSTPRRANFYKSRKSLPASFKGFLRGDGRAGIRNYIVVASTVNCSATVVKEITDYFRSKDFTKQGIDGIIPITHLCGCAQAIDGYGYKILNRTISGWLDHPNVVASLVIGLGCEVVTLRSLMAGLNSKHMSVECLNIQEVGGTKKTIKLGIERLKRLLRNLPEFRRINLPVSLLTMALQCGGSNAFSAITANPALGIAGDILVSRDGGVVLGEVPECYGAKKRLLERCLIHEDRDKLRQIFSWWDDYTKKNNVEMNDNISFGNITGGISTILEKSLGAIAKGGSSAINQVIDYAERVTKKGLIFMNTPGFDPVSVTGLVAGGCNLVAFTTGRGSMYGCSIAPTLKIASTSELYKRFKDDMDIDAGKALSQIELTEVGEEIYNSLIGVANGNKTLSEKQGIGKEEFAPWQVGETL